MTNNRQLREEIHSYFAEEPVPPVIHDRVISTCRNLEPRHCSKTYRPVWKKMAVSCGALAAAFVLLCGVNAANPAFAESLPLIGKAFRLYNEGKTTVGTYMGTYEEVAQVNSLAVAEDTQGLSLILDESYSDGKYAHLTFSMQGASPQILEDLYYLGGKVTATADGQPLDEAYITLYPEGDTLLGAVSLPLKEDAEDGTSLRLSYQVTNLVRYFDNGGDWEELPGSFEGQLSLTVDTSHNRTLDQMENNGTIQINQVEVTPSYTKISYTIPFWGISSYTMGFPRLYLEDGTEIQYNVNLSQVPSPEEISRDAETISGTACFDGLPNGTQTVILRFLEEDLYGKSTGIGVLAETTIDLATGEAAPSKTYLDAGMVFASDYQSHFNSIHWTMPFDDPDMIALGQGAWSSVTAIPGLFQNGQSLWSVEYDGDVTMEFVTDGPAPEQDRNVTVTDAQGEIIAQGVLSADTAEQYTAGGDPYYSWQSTLETAPGTELKLMDTVTVTLTDPDSGETMYQRDVRLVNKD